MGLDANELAGLSNGTGKSQRFLAHARPHIDHNVARFGKVSPEEAFARNLVDPRKVQSNVGLMIGKVTARSLMHPDSVVQKYPPDPMPLHPCQPVYQRERDGLQSASIHQNLDLVRNGHCTVPLPQPIGSRDPAL